mmetsp:Transcript_66580/g.198939  ORF Transcript_66580/g.198939 Transcript_66580/m.198939 type:complete len:325 (+) Transcript_66580:3594-4568(+)
MGIATMRASGASERTSSIRTMPSPTRHAGGTNQDIQLMSPKNLRTEVHVNQLSGKPIAYVLSRAAITCTKVRASFTLAITPDSRNPILVWCTQERNGTPTKSKFSACCSCRKYRRPPQVKSTSVTPIAMATVSPASGHTSQTPVPASKYCELARQTWHNGPACPSLHMDAPAIPPWHAEVFSPVWQRYSLGEEGERRQKPSRTRSSAKEGPKSENAQSAPCKHRLQSMSDADVTLAVRSVAKYPRSQRRHSLSPTSALYPIGHRLHPLSVSRERRGQPQFWPSGVGCCPKGQDVIKRNSVPKGVPRRVSVIAYSPRTRGVKRTK